MNTNETKAKIWNMCIEKGVFNKVKGENFNKMQETFERIIKGYEQQEPSLEVFNKIIDSLSIEIQNNFQIPDQDKIQLQKQSISYESIQKEYDQLLNIPPPKQIDFTEIDIKPKQLKLEENKWIF